MVYIDIRDDDSQSGGEKRGHRSMVYIDIRDDDSQSGGEK